MPRRRRTAAELRRELHELRDSYISDGIELSELANALRSYKRASEFIRRYDPSHPQYEAAVQEKESSEELAKKGKALLNLDDRIKRARLREEFDAAQASRANDSVSGPPQQSNASSNRADSAGPQQESRANDPSGPPLAHPQQPQQPASYQTSRQRTRSRRARSQPRADGPALGENDVEIFSAQIGPHPTLLARQTARNVPTADVVSSKARKVRTGSDSVRRTPAESG